MIGSAFQRHPASPVSSVHTKAVPVADCVGELHDVFLNLGQDRYRIRGRLVDQSVAFIHRLVVGRTASVEYRR